MPKRGPLLHRYRIYHLQVPKAVGKSGKYIQSCKLIPWLLTLTESPVGNYKQNYEQKKLRIPKDMSDY